MIKAKIFHRDECPSHPDKYMIRADLDKFYLEHTAGSFHVIQARLFGITYPEYLRMCRDCFGAEIVGKNSYFPYPTFKFSKELNDLIDQLNARANFVLWEREHPDHEEHAALVKGKN